MVIIGFIIMYINDKWMVASAEIMQIEPLDDKINMKIEYDVNDITYTKNITTHKININDKIIKIYVDCNNPNIIKLHDYDYFTFGMIITITGTFMIGPNILKYNLH